MLAEGLEGVLGAGGSEAAARLLERRNAHLIEAYQEYERCDRYLADNAFYVTLPLSHLP